MIRFIPAPNLFAQWRKDSEYIKEYDALEDEFSAVEKLIEARKHIKLSQDN